MKKLLSLSLVLALCLSIALPAFAAGSAFGWSCEEYASLFDVMLLQAVQKTATWKNVNATTRSGSYENSPEIVVTSNAAGKVERIDMASTFNINDMATFYDRGYAMGEAMACMALTAAMLTDPSSLNEAAINQFTVDMQSLMTNAMNEVDTTKDSVGTESITFGGITLSCTVTFSQSAMSFEIAFSVVPVI